jgi:hypothetical protein
MSRSFAHAYPPYRLYGSDPRFCLIGQQ